MQKSLNRVQEAFLRLVHNRAYSHAYNALKQMHPADLAQLLPYLQEREQQWFVETLLKTRKLGGVISELDENKVLEFLELVPQEEFVKVLEEINADDAADLIAGLPEGQRQEIFERLSGSQKKAVGKLLGYAPDTAGGIMSPEFVSMEQTLTVGEAIDQLRAKASGEKEEIYNIYICDADDQLVGVVSFRDLVLSPPDKTLQDIMERNPVAVRPHANQELVADMIARYNLLSVPVIDENHRLIGRITVDDAIDVLKEEATEDIYHLGNLAQEDHISTPVWTSAKPRALWLLINLGTAVLAAATISLFSETISRFVILAALMPIVSGMGGNAGTQSLTVVVRGLALGEVDWSLALKVIWKELAVGLFNGVIIGAVIGVLTYLWYHNLTLAMVMVLAMVGNLIIAALAGAFIPLLLRKLRQDPALASSIFVTTATDVGGFLLFLGLSTIFIKLIIS
ncbi:magnesium transporter [Candidatus Uhrbacteria bacterium CG10_big_fil_rev_8_21_14_0_10_48_11]|uniref:Magnesium transporter MgtE n=1 Tax=Candidatus Uhrbacteria bacterium CG10_big_fil_rev_8_21_14_0_10_48_11 TaxID=1975037 RepID=A0A2M8LDT5_9BACT|nr:MAG: magnesium transporter [Candidatus Uhrbacteria bacterium CG10_big_fil_rev_8_21_14_0_10_48_11]